MVSSSASPSSSSSLEQIHTLGKRFLDPTISVPQRIRLLFTLKALPSPETIHYLSTFLNQLDESILIKHEAAYALGQMHDPRAIPYLIKVLGNEKQDCITRHEAAEALGNLGGMDLVEVLERFVGVGVEQRVRETCQIAIEKLKWMDRRKREEVEMGKENPIFTSVDPAPPATGEDVQELSKQLQDTSQNLFERYRAMFALRNINTDASVVALCQGMQHESSSALFRHEVAYILGQMQNPVSIPTLVAHLKDTNEDAIVRHESAEALGSIATENCRKVLEEYLRDDVRVVKESCMVALDIRDYVLSDQFSYTEKISA